MNKIKTRLSALIASFILLFSLSAFVQPVNAVDYSAEHTKTLALTFDGTCDVAPGEELNSDNCGIVAYIVLAINILSALAGLAITASIMIAGFQYMTARDNAGQIQAARQRIVWALIALLLFIFSYALLNFLVPGGVL